MEAFTGQTNNSCLIDSIAPDISLLVNITTVATYSIVIKVKAVKQLMVSIKVELYQFLFTTTTIGHLKYQNYNEPMEDLLFCFSY